MTAQNESTKVELVPSDDGWHLSIWASTGHHFSLHEGVFIPRAASASDVVLLLAGLATRMGKEILQERFNFRYDQLD